MIIHPTADVQTIKIGDGTIIWQFSIILPGAEIGTNCNINCYVFIENDVVLGNNVTIKSGVQLWDGLRIKDNVFIGPNVTFSNDHVPRSKRKIEKIHQTVIEKGASIGANSTILDGIVIGSYAFIGAGSVITKDIPAFTLWYGNPAIHRGYVTKDGTILDLNLIDKNGKKYKDYDLNII